MEYADQGRGIIFTNEPLAGSFGFIATATSPTSSFAHDQPAALTRFRGYAMDRYSCYAAIAYAMLLCLMFFRLFAGDALSAGAMTRYYQPFGLGQDPLALTAINWDDADATNQFNHFEYYQYQSALQGRFPTWNPAIFCGAPFHGNGQSALLDPFNLAYFVMDPDTARGPVNALRLWISAMAMFWLLRRWSFVPAASFVGGTLWIFSSFNMHWLLWPHTHASLWIPVVVLAADHLLLSPNRRQFAVTALLSSPMFLAGHPGTIYLAMLTVVCCIAFRLMALHAEDRCVKKLAQRCVWSMGAMILAGCIAAAALLPLAMQIRNSIQLEMGTRGSLEKLPMASLWLFIIPEFFNRVRGSNPMYCGPINYMEMSFWFGLIGLALAIAGLLSLLPLYHRKTRCGEPQCLRFAGFFGAAMLIVSLLVVFVVPPIYQLATHLPWIGNTSLRRMLLATHFAGAILGALGLHKILRDKNRMFVAVCLALSLSGFIAIICVLTHWHWSQLQLVLSGKTSVMVGFHDTAFRIFLGAISAGVGCAALAWLLFAMRSGREAPRWSVAVLLLIVSVDVMLPAIDFHPIASRQFVDPPLPRILSGALEHVGDGRLVGTDDTLMPDMSMRYGFRDLRGYDLPTSSRLWRAITRADLLRSSSGDSFFLASEWFRDVIEPQKAKLLDHASVKLLMTFDRNARSNSLARTLKVGMIEGRPPGTSGTRDWPLVARSPGGVELFENPNAYPRVYFATNFTCVWQEQALDALIDPSRNLRESAVIESTEKITPPTQSPASGTVGIAEDQIESITLQSQSQTGGLVVLTDRMDQGWQVKIDDVPAPALYTDYLFRGVIVPPGLHRITWTYHAPGLGAGSAISLLSLAALLAMLWPGGRNRSEN